jgi:hypothetical protein
MDHPPSPPAMRARAKAAHEKALPPTVAPPHRSATPRATSAAPDPVTYAAALMTSQTNYYDPLRNQDDKLNPFHFDDLEDEEELQSPDLLTAPADVTVMAAIAAVDAGVITDDTFAMATDADDTAVDDGVIPGDTIGTATDADDTANPPTTFRLG